MEQPVHTVVCKVQPLDVRHSSYTGIRGGTESVVSVSAGSSTLLLLYMRRPVGDGAQHLGSGRRPCRRELAFESHHGSISCHEWLPSGKLLLGFSTGASAETYAFAARMQMMSQPGE